MKPTPSSSFAIEIHPPAWHFPAGPSWVAGWIWPDDGKPVTDLRAWVGARCHLGLYGLPRPEIEQPRLGRPGPPGAGFSFLLDPPAAPGWLRLEMRDASGRWVEFFRTAITPAATTPVTRAPSWLRHLPSLLPDLLRLGHLHPEQSTAALAAELLAGVLAAPLNCLPNPPFYGALEEPKGSGRLRYGRLCVTGWLTHRTEPVTRLTALVDATRECALLHGLDRRDVDHTFADFDLPRRAHSQFVGYVNCPPLPSAPLLLKIFAELANGEKHLVFAQRFTPRNLLGGAPALPVFSHAACFRAWRALLRSARRLGQPMPPPLALGRASRQAWAACRSASPAPAGRGPTQPVFLAPAADCRPLRILVATHNLNPEGAPWFVFELARHYRQAAGCAITVVSPQDGPMREVFARAGMTVRTLDLGSTFAAASPRAFDEALAAATPALDPAAFDLVVANTLPSFWAVHWAHRHRLPSLFYIHESSPVQRFFEPLSPPGLMPVIEHALRRAGRVVFTAASTQRVHARLDQGNFVLMPSWVDLDRVAQFKIRHDRLELRSRHGLDPAAVQVVNIGSLCERKGQHIFIAAIQLLQPALRRDWPDAKIQFVMVGARPGLYLDALRHEVELNAVADTVFLPETPAIDDFYHLADIFVCTSFEESFPRVLLESAAFGLPIVSTNVNGIAEMLGPDEAWLIPPGDPRRLADAMQEALRAHFAGDTARAARARQRIARVYDMERVLPQHLALAQQTARP